eukprot:scaffold673670_cov69-Prasinocladus_malaysianus.AAC.1
MPMTWTMSSTEANRTAVLLMAALAAPASCPRHPASDMASKIIGTAPLHCSRAWAVVAAIRNHV